MKRDNLFLGLASLILILVIFGPYAVSSGYFLTVDWIYADKLWPVETLYYPNQYPWILLQGWLSEIIPAFIVQKIVLAGLLLLSFSSTAFLLRRSNASNRWLILVGMIFFVFNSFFYARFAQGQVYLLLGHALLPYVLGYWLYARDRWQWKDILLGALIAAVAASLSPHSLYFLVPICIVMLLIRMRSVDTRRIIGFALATILVILSINAYWITQVSSQTNLDRFSLSDAIAFSTTVSPGENLYAKLLSLRGFWGETSGRILPTDTAWDSLGRVAFLLLFALAFIGAEGRLSNTENPHKTADMGLIAIAVIAYILSFGMARESAFFSINAWMFEHLPYYAGLREPHKWLSILAVVYGFFIVHGVRTVAIRLSRLSHLGEWRSILTASVGCITIISIGNPLMAWGVYGQLHGTSYPTSFHTLNTTLARSDSNTAQSCQYRETGVVQDCYDVLAFPWHIALSFPFTQGRVIANPAAFLLPSQRVLFGDNIEIGTIYSQSDRLASRAIEKYVGPEGLFWNGDTTDPELWFRYDLGALGIHHILLFKTADFERYATLLDTWFEPIEQTDEYTLYSTKELR